MTSPVAESAEPAGRLLYRRITDRWLAFMNDGFGKTSPRAKWRRRLVVSTAAMAAALIAAVSGFKAAVAWVPYPSDAVVVPERCTWIEDREGNALGAFVPASNQWNLPLDADQISPHLLNAIVAVEDRCGKMSSAVANGAAPARSQCSFIAWGTLPIARCGPSWCRRFVPNRSNID